MIVDGFGMVPYLRTNIPEVDVRVEYASRHTPMTCIEVLAVCAEPPKGALPGITQGAGPGGELLPLHPPCAGSCRAADAPGPVVQP